jgi:hypothetical protein
LFLLIIGICLAEDHETPDEGQEPKPDVPTLVDSIRQAIQDSLTQQATKDLNQHLDTLNKTAAYYLTNDDASTIRLTVFLAFLLFLAVLALWCICLAVKSAFKWLVNLVLIMAAIYLFFLIVEYMSVHFGWFRGTTFEGST